MESDQNLVDQLILPQPGGRVLCPPQYYVPSPQIFSCSYGLVGRALCTLKSAVSSVFHFTAIWSVRKNAFIHGKTQIWFLTLLRYIKNCQTVHFDWSKIQKDGELEHLRWVKYYFMFIVFPQFSIQNFDFAILNVSNWPNIKVIFGPKNRKWHPRHPQGRYPWYLCHVLPDIADFEENKVKSK